MIVLILKAQMAKRRPSMVSWPEDQEQVIQSDPSSDKYNREKLWLEFLAAAQLIIQTAFLAYNQRNQNMKMKQAI